MEAAPSDQSTGIGIEWGGGYVINVGGTGEGIGSGKSNTESIVTRLGSGTTLHSFVLTLSLVIMMTGFYLLRMN